VTRTLYSLQYLRATAAALVVIHHAREQFPGIKQLFQSPFGSAGVDVFFIISGFIMMYVSHGRNNDPLPFFTHRLVRVAPLYWAFTLLLASLLIIAPSTFRSTEYSTSALVNSLAFIPYEWDDGRVRPLLSIGWTLNYEMFFYALFSISLFFKESKNRISFISITLLTLIVSSEIFSSGFGGRSTYLSHYGSTITLEFLAGMITAKMFLSGTFGNRTRGVTLLSVGIALFILTAIWMPEDGRLRFLYFGIPAVLVVLGCLDIECSSKREKGNRLLLAMGESSYSLYVSHIFTLGILRALFGALGIEVNDWPSAIAFISIGLIACELVGYIVYVLFERPVSKASKKLVSNAILRQA